LLISTANSRSRPKGIRNDQTTKKGEAQNATQVRDIAVDALSDWLSDYIAAEPIP